MLANIICLSLELNCKIKLSISELNYFLRDISFTAIT